MLCPNCHNELIKAETEYPDNKAIEQWFDRPSCNKEFVIRYTFDYVMDTETERRASSWENLKS